MSWLLHDCVYLNRMLLVSLVVGHRFSNIEILQYLVFDFMCIMLNKYSLDPSNNKKIK